MDDPVLVIKEMTTYSAGSSRHENITMLILVFCTVLVLSDLTSIMVVQILEYPSVLEQVL